MDILHQDEHILVINKPAGLPVLPDGWQPDAPYLVKMLEEEFQNPSTALRQAQGDNSGQVWVVHRLDKVTSGVMVFARTAEAHRALNCQFERHEVEKVYHALVEGQPNWEEHTANTRCAPTWDTSTARRSISNGANTRKRDSGCLNGD